MIIAVKAYFLCLFLINAVCCPAAEMNEGRSMSTLLGVLAVIYGGSMVIALGGGVVWMISSGPRNAGEHPET